MNGPKHPHASRGPASRRAAWRVVALAAGTCAALALCETLLRWFLPQPASWLAIYAAHPRLEAYGLAPNQHALVETGECRWEVHTDSRGHRTGAATSSADPGLPTVLWLGDSFTFGYSVSHAESFVGRIAGRDRGTRIHVNAAVPGHGPREYADTLDDLLQQGLEPQAVIACTYVGNDLMDMVWDKPNVVRNGVVGDRGDLRSFVKRNLHTYRLASRAWQAWVPGPSRHQGPLGSVADPSAWSTEPLASASLGYRESFARMASTCATRGIPFHVVVLPPRQTVAAARGESAPVDSQRSDPRLPVAKVRSLLEQTGLAPVDVTDALAAEQVERTYFRHDTHFTPAGHALVADALVARLASLAEAAPAPPR